MKKILSFSSLFLFLNFPAVSELWACSVCFGNPESLLSKGAVAGVSLLLGVVAFVLGCVAWTIVVWARRAKKIQLPT